MLSDPSLIGTVQDVSGATITAALTSETASGISFVNGECYRIGQIGSFVRIPIGFINLYGLVSQVGAGASPIREIENSQYGNRWIKIQLVGEGKRGGVFQRGISQHPTIDDKVHIVTESDLKSIYGPGDFNSYVSIGHLASAESIPTYIEINKLVTRHCAIVGNTGCGKSTTVAGLLNVLSNESRFPSARIVVVDIHGEYQKALGNKCVVYKIGADSKKSEKELHIPFWALNFDELSKFAFNTLDDKKYPMIIDYLIKLKKESLKSQPIRGITAESLTVDMPTPFCLHKLWLELYTKDFMTIRPKPGSASNEIEIAYAKDNVGNELKGDAMKGVPPVFLSIKTTGTKEEKIEWGKEPLNMRQQLDALGAKLRDPRYDFICNPGKWTPNLEGCVENDLDQLLKGWIGNEKPVTILDLSGVPTTILNDIIGAVLRILYDAVFWARNLPEGARERPLLFVLEEAHAYLSKENSGTAATAVKKIAKEGRKYGVGMMVVSQRPSEIDQTILSQCGTIIAMRLANSADRGHVTGAAADHLSGLFDILPILRTGEAIIIGEAVSLPVRTLISPPPPNQKPDSSDPRVVTNGSEMNGYNGPGGWNQFLDNERYDIMVYQWRKQNANYIHLDFSKNKQTQGGNMSDWISTPSSSNVSGFSYESDSMTLTVEFNNGSRYEYYDVPDSAYEGMKSAGSVGQYLNSEIKNKFRYSKV